MNQTHISLTADNGQEFFAASCSSRHSTTTTNCRPTCKHRGWCHVVSHVSFVPKWAVYCALLSYQFESWLRYVTLLHMNKSFMSTSACPLYYVVISLPPPVFKLVTWVSGHSLPGQSPPDRSPPGGPQTISPWTQALLAERAQLCKLVSRDFSKRREVNIEFKFSTTNNYSIDKTGLTSSLCLLSVHSHCRVFSKIQHPTTLNINLLNRCDR